MKKLIAAKANSSGHFSMIPTIYTLNNLKQNIKWIALLRRHINGNDSIELVHVERNTISRYIILATEHEQWHDSSTQEIVT